MAYHFDSFDNSIVFDGFENGVGDSPYSGFSDMRNVNIVSVPGEASVNFSTSQISLPAITPTPVTVTGLSANVLSFAATTNLQNKMAIYFTSVGSLTGVSTGTTYWVDNIGGAPSSPTSCKLYSNYGATAIAGGTLVVIGGSAGGATFVPYLVGSLNGSPESVNARSYFTQVPNPGGGNWYFMQDGKGQVWCNRTITDSNGINDGRWTYTGITGTADTGVGGGLVGYTSSDGTSYVFSFNSSSIDFITVSTMVWTWGWNPSTAATHQTNYLKYTAGTGGHQAMWAPDGTVYYCDGNWVGTWFQKDIVTPVAFVPTTLSTYTPAQYELLPIDTAQCLSFLGDTVLIGGQKNIIYSWDRSSPLPNSYILIPENNVSQMVTVNTNTYIFIGNRGRIYVTNGTNAQLFKKVPDHISGTVEPYFTWGGTCSVKNQLYFSVYATTNAGVANAQYGGVWAIDLDTKALRLTNQLSYGTYSGVATAITPNFDSNPSGTGLYIRWQDGTGTGFGIDTTSSTPYTGSQATIDTELIPIGTYNKPRDLTQVEYKLPKPLVAGESILIKTRLIFNTTDTGYVTTLTDSTVGNFSSSSPINFKNAQWVQFQIVLNSTATTPSYTRLKEIRILGLVGPSLAASQQLSL